jgi:hypothetical protein
LDWKRIFRKNDFGGVLGTCLAPKMGEGAVSKKNLDWKRVFRKNDFEGVLGKRERSFYLETSHIVRLASKIGKGRFHKTIWTGNVFFRKTISGAF